LLKDCKKSETVTLKIIRVGLVRTARILISGRKGELGIAFSNTIVTQAKEGLLGYNGGVRTGFRIYEINDKPVENDAQIIKALGKRGKVVVRLIRVVAGDAADATE
jgi:hypothetical protein